MADEKSTIVIKRINKGGHAAHGGAWKVAFADFMTAMMAFFMVMWLMGSDEATKAAVADYFKSASIFKGGSDSLDKRGTAPSASFSILNGMEGMLDEKDVQDPARPRPVYLEEHKILSKLIFEIFDGSAFSEDVRAEFMKFSIPGNIIFQFGSTDISYEGKVYLKKLAEVFKSYNGSVHILGHTEKGANDEANWKLAFDRAMAVRKSLIEEFQVNPNQLIPLAESSNQSLSGMVNTVNVNRRVEFILKQNQY
jgi:chemotaxis protein MotB